MLSNLNLKNSSHPKETPVFKRETFIQLFQSALKRREENGGSACVLAKLGVQAQFSNLFRLLLL